MSFLSTLGRIGAGVATGGLSEQFFNRPEATSPSELLPEGQNQQLIEQANRLEDPSFGFAQFRRLATDAAGSADQTLQATAATGGSERLARTRQQAQVQQAANDIMDRFGQFRLQAQQQAGQLRQQAIGNQMQAEQMALRQRNRRRQATRGAFQAVTNQINTIGGALLGAATGGGGAAAGRGRMGSFGRFRRMILPRGRSQQEVPDGSPAFLPPRTEEPTFA